LKAAGVPENQAEALSEAFRDAQSDAELTTKYDLKELKLRLEAKINEVKYDKIIWIAGMACLIVFI
jgi:tripartite-type tricarboxylate transporter receptor subunit TctC